ncbi:hypothetical protein CUMW_161320 [Citrus unshiu]|uniref:Cytochrome P450 n=1 Tax=Citrus unshiu TaxID=55188 RepID=A0A2H5PSG5_CITUN|nr:hypothetical protein CUMW_161320 [Citrus unshiu]
MSSAKLELRLREYAEWEINAFLWISLITVTLVLLQKVVKLFRLRHHARKIPGPPCSSFYGHCPLLSTQSLTEVLAESHEKYGSVVKLWLGPTKLLVSIKEPALIKEMLSKAEDKPPLTGRAFRLAFGQSSLFASTFDRVEKRRVTLSTELNGRLLERGKRNCKLISGMDHNFDNETAYKRMEAALGGSSSFDALVSQEPSGYLQAREEPCRNIMGVMFHGYLTTAGLVGNILARLATHQDIQEKIYSEIIMARKGLGEKDQQSVDNMLLLLATIYESARLLPAGPFLQRCSLKHDLTLKSGVTIPAGTVLVVPIQLVQMDNCSWGIDASQFNPYRFLSKKGRQCDQLGNISSTGNAEEYVDPRQSSFVLNDPNNNAAFLPFGSGSRACVGQKYVTQGIATLFASLLERYEIRLQPGSEKNPKPTVNNCVFQLLPCPEIDFVERVS